MVFDEQRTCESEREGDGEKDCQMLNGILSTHLENLDTLLFALSFPKLMSVCNMFLDLHLLSALRH